jgi:hypothetical protein
MGRFWAIHDKSWREQASTGNELKLIRQDKDMVDLASSTRVVVIGGGAVGVF